MDRNQLIEDAAKAIGDTWAGGAHPNRTMEELNRARAAAALAVFEGAYTPTDDEREALLSILSDLDYSDGGMMRWSSGRPTDQAEKVADRILREGFHRTAGVDHG